MVKKLGAVLIAVLFLAPTVVWAGQGQETKEFHQAQKHKKWMFWQKQKEEKKEFKEGLKGKTPEERHSAIKSYRDEEWRDKKAFNAQRHQENLDFLKTKLAGNKKLTEAQKNELVSHFEKQYQENALFRDERHSADVAFFEKIAGDTGLNLEQKKKAIHEYLSGQRETTRSHWAGQKTESRSERKRIRTEADTAVGTM